jgi:hypothetical protein
MHSAKQEVIERGRRNIANAKRLNAKICIGIGVPFAFFALACFVGAVMSLVAGGVEGEMSAGIGAGVGVGVFGLFWAALSALLLWLGVSGLRALDREERLRTSGVRARGIVLSYSESSTRVDGATKWQLSLRVEQEGQPPRNVTTTTAVMRGDGGKIFEGASLPVLVSASDPSELTVDWFSGE